MSFDYMRLAYNLLDFFLSNASAFLCLSFVLALNGISYRKFITYATPASARTRESFFEINKYISFSAILFSMFRFHFPNASLFV